MYAICPNHKFSLKCRAYVDLKIQTKKFESVELYSRFGYLPNHAALNLLLWKFFAFLVREERRVIIVDVMGQITIEVPQKLNRTYRIVSEVSAKEVLDKLDVMVTKANHVKKTGLLGLWADREESAEEIARELRSKSNNRHLLNG